MTKTHLLDLPNELFPFIFQYLNSTDLIEVFSDTQCLRMELLAKLFVSYLDISQKTDKWIHKYLPDLLRQQNIIALRLQDKHIALIYEYLPSSHLQSMHIFSSDWTTDALKQGLAHFRQHLKHLSITFKCLHGKGDIANYLFQSDCKLEYLTITGRFLFFDNKDISTCTQLTHLSIELEGMYRVFVLMKHLPNLQQLQVKFRNEERIIQQKLYVDTEISNRTLNRVTFTGCTKYFEHLEQFFLSFGSNIQCLTINIDLTYRMIDGKRLENELLDKIPCLRSLNLIIHSILTYCNPIEIETFQSSSWQNFNPIVYWHDVHTHQHTLFTLPYRSNLFKHLSNDFLLTCVSNRTVSLSFDSVRTLSLTSTTPLTVELFQFIEKAFPNIKTLELTKSTKLIGQEEDNIRCTDISHMNETFLSNTNLQLPSVIKFCYLPQLQNDTYKIFHRFMHLLPNLIYLQMFIGRNLFNEILQYEYADSFIRNALNRIQILQMVRFYDEKNVLSKKETQFLFPNAQILFDYDDL